MCENRIKVYGFDCVQQPSVTTQMYTIYRQLSAPGRNTTHHLLWDDAANRQINNIAYDSHVC